MSQKYKEFNEVPTDVLASRLAELSDVVSHKRESLDRETTMRVPAELDRDADLVLSNAALRLTELEQDNAALRSKFVEVEKARDGFHEECGRLSAKVQELEEAFGLAISIMKNDLVSVATDCIELGCTDVETSKIMHSAIFQLVDKNLPAKSKLAAAVIEAAINFRKCTGEFQRLSLFDAVKAYQVAQK